MFCNYVSLWQTLIYIGLGELGKLPVSIFTSSFQQVPAGHNFAQRIYFHDQDKIYLANNIPLNDDRTV